jgi:hypothetical protein
MTLRDHLFQLADELGVTIYYGSVPRYRSGINVTTGELHLGEGASEAEDYWVGMHELGHYVDLADKWANDEYREYRGIPGTPSFTAAEARAWAWAIKHALPEAFPLGQVGESNIAWSITDYMHMHGWEPSEAFELIFRTVGEEPDWFWDVTTPEHYAKLDGWARPMWAELAAHYAPEEVAA